MKKNTMKNTTSTARVVKGSKGGELHVQGKEASFDIEEWHEFCSLVLEILMDENKNILKNLKENW